VKGNYPDEIKDNFVDEALHNVNAVNVKDIHDMQQTDPWLLAVYRLLTDPKA
jgi:hypothetical protein